MTSNNSLAREWQRLATDHQIETVACVASLKKRHPAAEKHPADHLLHNTTVAGLGQYIDALQQADRVVNFGG